VQGFPLVTQAFFCCQTSPAQAFLNAAFTFQFTDAVSCGRPLPICLSAESGVPLVSSGSGQVLPLPTQDVAGRDPRCNQLTWLVYKVYHVCMSRSNTARVLFGVKLDKSFAKSFAFSVQHTSQVNSCNKEDIFLSAKSPLVIV